MGARLFTIVCEFRGSTWISQVSAADAPEAVHAWAEVLRRERPFARASAALAKRVTAKAADDPPVAILGLSEVWCIAALCGGDLMLANLIESVVPADPGQA